MAKLNGSDLASQSSKVSSHHMKLLLENLKNKGTRDSTRHKYHEIWRSFNKFIISLDVIPNKWEERTVLFCASLVERGCQSGTVRSYVSAIKRILVKDGYLWDEKIILFQAITKSCRQLNDRVRSRFPIQIGLFELILFELARLFDTPFVISLYRAIFTLAYYGLMRISELTLNNPHAKHYIRAKDVHVGTNKDKILLVLYTSKTHRKESRPQKIKIEAVEYHKEKRHFCPFHTVCKYMQYRGGYETYNEPFLGGLSLHLNHLIVERVSAPYRQFGTLPIGIFLSNLDSGQLETSLMTSYCHF